MRILFLSNIPTPYQLDFVKEVRKTEEVLPYFLWPSDTNQDWGLDNSGVLIAAFRRFSPGSYLRFAKQVLKFNPDCILAGGYRLPCSFIAQFLALFMGAKMCFWLESPLPAAGIKAFVKKAFISLRLKSSSGVFAVGKKAASYYSNFQKSTFNLPYSSDLTRFYRIPRSAEKRRPLSFLFAGQLIERKNIENILAAFAGVPDADVKLYLAGSGPLKDLVLKCVSKDTRIQYLGFISPGSLHETFALADVFLLPSHFDGWGVVAAEAMASGMPVIGTKECGCINEFIQHGSNGYVCTAGAGSIAEGMNFYLKNRDQIFNHGQKNRDIIRASLADAGNAARYLSITINNLR